MLPTPNIIEALQRLFPSVWLAGGDEIMVTCPYCHYRGMSEDKSGHLSLNFTKNVGHCVRCDWGHGNLRDWLQKKNFAGHLPLPRVANPFEKKKPVKYRLQLAEVPRSEAMGTEETNFFGDSLRDKRLEPQDWIDARIRKCYSGKLNGYVIFPFYEGPNLVYWQARAANPSIPVKRKKQNPFELDLGRACWLYGWRPDLPPESEIYIVEGPLDKISTQKFLTKNYGDGHFAVSSQGTAFSFPDDDIHALNTQFGKVMAVRPKRVHILFDPDALHKAKGLAETFDLCGFSDVNVGVLADNAGDPNEASESQVHEALTVGSDLVSQMSQKLNNASL